MKSIAGTIALIGKPNAGKSSLLNALVGERIAAVSHHPQTTRNRVLGIYTQASEELAFQAVLLDTPGIHEAWTALNESMVAVAEKTMQEVDLICWIVDSVPLVAAARKGQPILDAGLKAIAEKLLGRPHIVVLNKTDMLEDRSFLLPVMAAFGNATVVPISARHKSGLQVLTKAWQGLLPEQELLFDPELLTDEPERAIVAELIREQVFLKTNQEIPYASAVEIERFDESSREAGKILIHAKILVEKDSQKPIVIGKGGQLIKQIGMGARKSIEALLGAHVRLELFVAVEPGWSANPRMLKELGYQPVRKKQSGKER
jgi:GTP-binding protein Era